MRKCFQHLQLVEDSETVLVGAIERGSGPARPIYACRPCIAEHGIIPLNDHPAGTDGHPLYRHPDPEEQPANPLLAS